MFHSIVSEPTNVEHIYQLQGILQKPAMILTLTFNLTLNCKISGEHQIQTLKSVGHLRPGWTSEPRPKWPMLAI